MKRNPKLAHEVTQLPEIADLRHKAIDTLTSLGMAVAILNRPDQNDPVKELDHEQRVQTLMLEAVYWYGKYFTAKLEKYEHALSRTIERGNQAIAEFQEVEKDLNQVKETVDELRQERGLQ